MAGLAHDDSVVDRLAVVLRSRDGRYAGVGIGEDVAPGPHPRDVHLVICERDGDARPVGRGDQVKLAIELLRDVCEEGLVGLRGLRRRRLKRPHAEAELPPFILGEGRERGRRDHGEQ
jgi:hypothetical protein